MVAVSFFATQFELTAQAQTNLGDYTIPLIAIEEVPFSDLVKALARQAGINYVTAPRVSQAENDTNIFPLVDRRWTNVTANATLDQLLTEHHLHLINNPQTTVAIISEIDRPPMKFDESFISGTNSVIPLIVTKDVPLYTALNQFALAVDVPFDVDPQLSGSDVMVNIQWEGLTARQALAALCDNYNLKVTSVGTNRYFRISQN
ncbi:MAG TPA: hypothetical protein VH255_06415 [Verrucomicrobiae bacterium]|nr:hypothetical protein [Verrucomicrobiae bacterium]